MNSPRRIHRCDQPITLVNPRYTSEKYKGEKADAARMLDYYIQVPCGKCIYCRQAKGRDWHFRMYHEYHNTSQINVPGQGRKHRVWFVTFTFSDDNLPSWTPSNVRQVVAPFVRSWYENWRSKYGIPPRYIAVTDVGSKREPRLHLHLFLFEPRQVVRDDSGKILRHSNGKPVTTTIALSKAFSYPIRYKKKQMCWKYGWTTYAAYLDGEEGIHYAAGYLTGQQNQDRIRDCRDLSKHGKQMSWHQQRFVPSTFCSHGIGKSFTATSAFAVLSRGKILCVSIGGFTFRLPRYYRRYLFDPAVDSPYGQLGPPFVVSKLARVRVGDDLRPPSAPPWWITPLISLPTRDELCDRFFHARFLEYLRDMRDLPASAPIYIGKKVIPASQYLDFKRRSLQKYTYPQFIHKRQPREITLLDNNEWCIANISTHRNSYQQSLWQTTQLLQLDR